MRERSVSPITRLQREIATSAKARRWYPEAFCQPRRPRSAMSTKVPIALGRRGRGRRAWHRVLARRYDDRRRGMAFGHDAGHVLPVLGAVTRARAKRSRLALVALGRGRRAVICLVAGQLHGLDPPG